MKLTDDKNSLVGDFNTYCMNIAGTLSYVLANKTAEIPQNQIEKLHLSFFNWFQQYKFIKDRISDYEEFLKIRGVCFMNNEKNTELSQRINHVEILERMKDTYGIEFFVNELLPVDLESQGYRKMSIDEVRHVEPLLQLAPQLSVKKMNKGAVEKAFKAATENSYKCLIPPSMHLANIKGTTDVFIGTGLDNVTNKVSGQARWLKNDAVLSVSNAPQFALNAFNAISTVTGQYFMAQVNANLLDIKDGIDDIKQYIEAEKQSELETALQELYEIIEHTSFMMDDSERVSRTLIQIDGIRKVAKDGINFHKKQIEKTMSKFTNSDKETTIKNNINELRKNMVQYRHSVYVYNLAQILKIYLNNITDVEELGLYRKDLSDIVNQYKGTFDKATKRAKHYVDETNSLNKTSKKQRWISSGSGIFGSVVGEVIGGKIGRFMLGELTESLANVGFDNNRIKRKENHIRSNKVYQNQMNDMELIDSSISAMDRYIDMTGKKAEIVSIDGECYIKYIEEE
jgi:hypothetical protein